MTEITSPTRRRLLRGLALAGGAAVLSGCAATLPSSAAPAAGRFVRRLITLGTPHAGVAVIPFTGLNSLFNFTILPLCYVWPITTLVVPCSYVKSLRHFDSYSKLVTAIADLNNERAVNEEY